MNKNYEVINLDTVAGIEPSGVNVFFCGSINNDCVSVYVFCDPTHDWFCGTVPDFVCHDNNPWCQTSIGNGNR